LSDKLARSGFGRVNFSDLILALAGMAIHTWVFQSPFPKCLTRPDKSIRLLEELLDEKGRQDLLIHLQSFKRHADYLLT